MGARIFACVHPRAKGDREDCRREAGHRRLRRRRLGLVDLEGWDLDDVHGWRPHPPMRGAAAIAHMHIGATTAAAVVRSHLAGRTGVALRLGETRGGGETRRGEKRGKRGREARRDEKCNRPRMRNGYCNDLPYHGLMRKLIVCKHNLDPVTGLLMLSLGLRPSPHTRTPLH